METLLRPLDRQEFLRLVGTGLGAILLTHCLTGCSKDDDGTTPTPPGGSNPVDFTLNLTEANNAALATNGGSVVRNNIIVARTLAGGFLAVSQVCTHEGTPSVEFRSASGDFFCPRHGSRFSATGAVTNGPAAAPLKQYKTTFTASANTLRVFE
jgi:cytochrome b6-f complex iron-sulfur subunit